VHLAIYAAEGADAPGRRVGGATQLGFQVGAAIEAAVRAGVAAGGSVLQPLEDVPWGRRAVLADPDGRPVELNCAADD
jgi:predicted enzyme related to lactoylglutathione lyase